MGLRQKEWAARKRTEITTELGGCCMWCGTSKNLTFDCIQPRGHAHHPLESSARISFYRKMLSEANLQLLCKLCNEKKGGNGPPFSTEDHTPELPTPEADNQPF